MSDNLKIIVYAGPLPNQRVLQICHPFFIGGEYVICVQKPDAIIFTKPTIDYNGKTSDLVSKWQFLIFGWWLV